MKRVATPVLSRSGKSALRQYEQVLCEQEDLTPASVRNYLSDVRQFMAWYEAQAEAAERPDPTFTPQSIATRHRFGYRMAESVPLHRLAQIMGHDSLDTTKLYIQGTKHDLQQAVETIAWT
jgi:site-specific recombinase XerD